MMLRLAVLMLVALVAAPAHAQTFPSKTVRWIVPLPPGGSTDLISRLLAQKLSDMWHVPVVVENRVGAAGTVGLAAAAKSPPDGYTIALAQTSNLAVAPGLYPKLGYDPLKDLAAVTQVVSTPMLLVAHPSLPARNVRSLIALARSRPNAISYASGGTGGQTHLPMELFAKTTGIRMVHVPYKGVGPVVVALLSGEVALGLSSIPPVLPHVKSGKLRALAITSARRYKGLPEVPTMAEDGVPGYDVSVWYGVVMPGGTPSVLVSRVHDDVTRILAQPDVNERLTADAGEVVASTPEAFSAYIKSELARWTKVIAETGVKAE
jgi:tripartite-type tricarboxylate transporter receptor subunit TctC